MREHDALWLPGAAGSVLQKGGIVGSNRRRSPTHRSLGHLLDGRDEFKPGVERA